MGKDVRIYFNNYNLRQKAYDPMISRIAIQLCRGGVTDMELLCTLLEREPQSLLALRNIGQKSMGFIMEVCKAYKHD